MNPTCPILNERNAAQCTRHVEHGGHHLDRHGNLWATSGDLLDGGVTAAAIENEVVSPERARSLVQERNEAKAEAAMCQTSLRGQIRRAEQAEDTLLMVQQQRDHLRATLAATARQRDEADRNDHPRPLTADDLSDEAIRRARVAWLENAQSEGIPSAPTIRAMFAAALTPPPFRPEGAEEIEAVLSESPLGPEAVRGSLADFLAARGVRVTGAES